MPFPVAVYNCSNRDIVVRYVPMPPHKGGRLLLTARGAGTVQDAHDGMEIFAAAASDEMIPFARLTTNSQAREVHFTDSAGNYGRGAMPDPPLEPRSGLGARQPAAQSQAAPLYGPVDLTAPVGSDQLLPATDARGGLDMAPALSAAPQLSAPSGGGGGAPGGNSELENVPGLGWMKISELKPEMQAHVRALQAQAAAAKQQGAEQEAPPPPQPLPQYTLAGPQEGEDEGQMQVRGGTLSKLLDSWTLPALILLLAVLALAYIAYYKPRFGGGAKVRSGAARARRWS